MRYKDPDLRLLVKIGRLYYLEGRTQDEISARYQTSRSTVSRLIKQAREMGLVTITINEPEEARYTTLEAGLEQRYGLHEAVVLPSGEDEAATRERLGRAAAAYLLRVLQPGQILGISMGSTLHAVVQAVEVPSPLPVKVVPLLGGSGRTDPELHANQLAIGLARSLGGTCYPLHAPALTSSPELRDALLADAGLREVLDLGQRAQVALVGIGAPDAGSTMLQTGYLAEADLAAIQATGAVGDCCSQFFNTAGRPCAPNLAARVVGITLEQLQRIPLVIAVAGGLAKVQAIAGALRGRLVSVLVTDAATAAALVGATEGPA